MIIIYLLYLLVFTMLLASNVKHKLSRPTWLRRREEKADKAARKSLDFIFAMLGHTHQYTNSWLITVTDFSHP